MNKDRLSDNSKITAQIDFTKGDGLVPVVVQEVGSNIALMCAYADRHAVNMTIETGYAHYYSRSRRRLWKKGETSHNVQRIRDIYIDCDNDTLLYVVEQQGSGACHTGHKSCFYRRLYSAT